MRHKLILLRHGHATFEGSSDFLRPLSTAGREAIRRTARHLKPYLPNSGIAILSSDTLRTRESADILAQECHIDRSFIHTDCELYGATPGLWLKKIPAFLHNVPVAALIAIGHNPAMSQLLAILTGKTIHMHTGACAVTDTEWKDDQLVLPATLVDYFDPNKG